MKLTNAPGNDWVEEARAVWERKSGLRDYYRTQIFERIISEMNVGETLQLGAGAGFFSQYHSGMINSDIINQDGIDVVSDVHNLQFSDDSFDNIVGIDVLHHFASPGLAMKECARVLRPGGRIVLVEPWAGLIGWLFYKYIHHEDCFNVQNPWSEAFPGDKKPMDGNAAIPKFVLCDRANELSDNATNLQIIKKQYFGSLSFILTGGFQNTGLPAPIIRILYSIENILPQFVLASIAFRALFIIEKDPLSQSSSFPQTTVNQRDT